MPLRSKFFPPPEAPLRYSFFNPLFKISMKQAFSKQAKATFVSGLLAAAVMSTVPAMAQNLAIVNGKPVPTSRAAAMERQLAATGQAIDDNVRAQIKQEIINREILIQAATARGLNKTQAYADQMEMARQSILIRALFAEIEAKANIDDTAIKAEYDRIANSPEATEYRASHILVETEAEAKDLTAKLAAGADFAAFAKQYSKDPGSGAEGGDLNFAAANSYVPEFSNAMIALAVGQTTAAPVQSQFGWHIIRLTDKRKRALPPLAEVKDAIAKQLRENSLSKAQDDLLKKAKIQ
jgi:peptidyl-prolyl cis-trans isomerase C